MKLNNCFLVILLTFGLASNSEHAFPKNKELPDWVENPKFESGIAATGCVVATGRITTDSARSSLVARNNLSSKIIKDFLYDYSGVITDEKKEKITDIVDKGMIGSRRLRSEYFIIDGRRTFCSVMVADQEKVAAMESEIAFATEQKIEESSGINRVEIKKNTGGTHQKPQIKSNPKVSVIVDTIPKDTKIRIMNIRPTYKRGMELDPGRYRIAVEKQGYRSFEKWFDVSDSTPIKIELEKLAVSNMDECYPKYRNRKPYNSFSFKTYLPKHASSKKESDSYAKALEKLKEQALISNCYVINRNKQPVKMSWLNEEFERQVRAKKLSGRYHAFEKLQILLIVKGVANLNIVDYSWSESRIKDVLSSAIDGISKESRWDLRNSSGQYIGISTFERNLIAIGAIAAMYSAINELIPPLPPRSTTSFQHTESQKTTNTSRDQIYRCNFSFRLMGRAVNGSTETVARNIDEAQRNVRQSIYANYGNATTGRNASCRAK